MGLLEQVIGGVLGSQGSAGGRTSPLAMALMALLASRGGGAGGLGGLLGSATGAPSTSAGAAGGLGGLLERLTQGGHGDIAQSWVGPGENRPIQPGQLGDALGRDTVDDLSRQTGMPGGDLLAQLSRYLPGIVDQLTPQGRMPDQHEASRW